MKRIDAITEGIAVGLSIIQSDEFLQIISFVLTALSVVVSIAFTVYQWYKKAKEDGKITKDEIEDLKNKVEEDVNKLKK